MDYKFIVTQPAKRETIDAYLWYEERKIGLGEDFFDELHVLYGFIKTNPNLFPIKHKKIYHEAVLKHFPFVILYVLDESEILVLSVFKTPRDPELKP
jgi:hypothetical protein